MLSCFMKSLRLLVVLLAVAICVLTGIGGVADAEDTRHPAGPADVVGTSGLKVGQEELIREFEASSAQAYTLGAGDEIYIQVPSQPDIQGQHVIGPDGDITLPLVGPTKIAGLTREDAAKTIETAWGKYYSTVSVTVRVTKYGSNRIVVVGRVASPGPIYFDTAPSLLEALSKSGAFSPRPSSSGSSATMANVKADTSTTMINRCAIYRGTDQVLWIDMKEMFTKGYGVDLHLRRDDVVFVPEEQEDLVSVLGEVQRPGAIRLTADARLVDVLAMAGGLTEDAASNKIRIVRPATGTTREIALKDLLDSSRANSNEASLKPGDVIYVPKSGMGKIGYVFSKFSPAGSLLMVGAMAK